jgi:AcrR family transcriptional regulator
MPRPNQSAEKRQALLPILAEAFAEVGSRKATTAELARRCGVQETILYRLWVDKRAMFLASIDRILEHRAARGIRTGVDPDGAA